MEDIIELILTILFMPFEDKHNKLLLKMNKKNNKSIRIVLKILLFIIPTSLIIGLVGLCSYVFRGYWF